MDLETHKISSMWQTSDGRIFSLSLNDQMKIKIEALGTRRLNNKPCSDCHTTGRTNSLDRLGYTLFKGNNHDWLCRECAKLQKII